MSELPSKKRRARRFWTLAAIVLLSGAAVTSWVSVNRYVRGRVESELARVFDGATVRIGSVNFGITGVTASRVDITNQQDIAPWLVVERLTIHEPIWNLILGTDEFDHIAATKPRAVFRVDQLNVDSVDVDLADIDFPADELSVRQAQIVVQQRGRTDLAVDDLNVRLNKTADGISIRGRSSSVVGNTVVLSGELNRRTRQTQLTIRSDKFELRDDQWIRWPGVPQDINQHLVAGGVADVLVEFQSTPDGPLAFQSTVRPQHIDLNLPTMNLALGITGGEFKVTSSELIFSQVRAATDARGSITASGRARIGIFPVTTTFETNFQGVSDHTLRNLVPQIPVEVAGRVDGTARGRVEVGATLETLVAVQADATSSDLRYGSVTSANANVMVNLEKLKLDQEWQPLQLDGEVRVTAQTENEPLANVFKTFELQSLQEQLGLMAETDATVALALPLATVEQINTWSLSVEGDANEARFSGQPLGLVHATAKLDNGRLVLKPITARIQADPTPPPDSKIEVAVDWPLTDDATEPNQGRVHVTATQVPPAWLIDVAEFHKQLIDPDVQAKFDRALTSDRTEISGDFNFVADLTIDASAPDDVDAWQLQGTIADSTVAVGDERLNGFSTSFGAENSRLVIHQAAGQFESGGQLNGDVTVDLARMELELARMTFREIPLAWSAHLASRLNDDFAGWLETAELKTSRGSQDLSGYFSAEMTASRQTPDQSDQAALLQLETVIRSEQLQVKQQVFNDIVVGALIEGPEIEIDRLQAKLGDGGSLSGNGNWNTSRKSGAANLQWSSLPVAKVFDQLGLSGNEQFQGTLSGNVAVRSPEGQPVDEDLAWHIAGTVEANRVSMQRLSLPPQSFTFALESRDAKLFLSQFRRPGDENEIGVTAQFELKTPFAFQVDSNIDSLALGQVAKFELADDDPLAAWLAQLSGELEARFNVAGQLEPFDWSSTGSANLRQVSVRGKSIGPMQASWTNLSSGPNEGAAVEISLLGGKIETSELDLANQRAAVSLKNLQATQVSTALALPVSLTGQLSGDAILRDWSDPEKRQVKATVRGGSTVIGDTELAELDGFLQLQTTSLRYGLNGRLLDGRFFSNGETTIDPAAPTEYPLELRIEGVSLKPLYQSTALASSWPDLDGKVAATADVKFSPTQPAQASGRLNVENIRYDRKLVARAATSRFTLRDGILELGDVRSDFIQGEVAGNASFSVNQASQGHYNLSLRRLNLKQLGELLTKQTLDWSGSFDARLSGRLGRTVSGQGEIGLVRAELYGGPRQSFQLPIQFELNSATSGRVEVRRSQIRLFDGRVSGKARVDFHNEVDIDIDLALADLDTAELFQSLAGSHQQSQGRLSGRLKLQGRSVRTSRDLSGSFKGNLTQAQSFKLPVLENLAVFLNNQALVNRTFDSDEIDLQLANGAIVLRQLNFTNSVAKVAVFGTVYLNKRLDLRVAARIERFDQPTLVDEFFDSPLALLSGSPVAFYTQVAEFLSDRIVRVRVGGNISRPVFRLDPSGQIKEELIRYFLRDAKIPELRQNR